MKIDKLDKIYLTLSTLLILQISFYIDSEKARTAHLPCNFVELVNFVIFWRDGLYWLDQIDRIDEFTLAEGSRFGEMGHTELTKWQDYCDVKEQDWERGAHKIGKITCGEKAGFVELAFQNWRDW